MRWQSLNLSRYVKMVPELAKQPTRPLNFVWVSFWSQTGLDPHVKLSSTSRRSRLPLNGLPLLASSRDAKQGRGRASDDAMVAD
jgi:hypothetical protein